MQHLKRTFWNTFGLKFPRKISWASIENTKWILKFLDIHRIGSSNLEKNNILEFGSIGILAEILSKIPIFFFIIMKKTMHLFSSNVHFFGIFFKYDILYYYYCTPVYTLKQMTDWFRMVSFYCTYIYQWAKNLKVYFGNLAHYVRKLSNQVLCTYYLLSKEDILFILTYLQSYYY